MALQDGMAEVKVAPARRAARPGWMRILQSKTAVVGLFLVAFWIAAAVLAPILPLPSPTESDVMAMGNPFPSAAHWLGTDILGRDVLARLIFGARTVLSVAPLSVAVAMVGARKGSVMVVKRRTAPAPSMEAAS